MTDGIADDEVLAARAARGDASAFERLYERHAPWIYAWAARALGSDRADDVLQEVFLRAWRAADQFDPARGRFAGWLGAIARHHLARQMSRAGPRLEPLGVEAIDAIVVRRGDDDGGPEDQVWRHERDHAVVRALQRLPGDQRRVVLLAYFAGMTQSEIAHVLEIPLGTVKTRIRLAMRKLRPAVEEEGMAPTQLRVVTEE